MTETATPTHWYVIVSGGIDAYVTNFTTMRDPSLERLEAEGRQVAKLMSSSFVGLSDYEEVLDDARDWVQLITGAMHINQDPPSLEIVNVVGVFEDGTTKNFPPHGRVCKIRFGIPTRTEWNKGATPRVTFEQSVVLFARQSGNPFITDVLRFLALSPDWFGLYKAVEVIKFDLNKVAGKTAGYEHIVANGWATKGEIDAFKTTALHHRHWKRPALSAPMDLIDARQLVGHIVTKWITDVSRRSATRG